MPYLDAAAKARLGDGALTVHRRQLPYTNAMALTAYNLQGQEAAAIIFM